MGGHGVQNRCRGYPDEARGCTDEAKGNDGKDHEEAAAEPLMFPVNRIIPWS